MNRLNTMCGLIMIFCMLFVLLVPVTLSASTARPGRVEIEISGAGWQLWLDHAALWYNDDVFMPPVDMSKVPVNPPTCGWDGLDKTCRKTVAVPGTVEEHFWGAIGGAIPDTGGDYVGVSWWSTTFRLDPGLKGKRVTICFESVNLRAEVFVNKQLVGYDVIGNTPFEADATGVVVFGTVNRLDVRITDPVGNFNWNDNILMRWGKNLVPAVHGFGGITGPVILRMTDAVHVDDLYVENKPNPKEADVFVTLGNSAGKKVQGDLTLVVHEWKKPAGVLLKTTVPVSVPAEGGTFPFHVNAPEAKLWELSGWRTYKQANLYEASVHFTSTDGVIEDSRSQRFGFRWFDIGEKDGDKRFYLNGKRVFIIAAMTRGFWPKNGIFATPEMAQRDMEILVDLGYNMMLLHRAIGQPPVMEYSDRMGLLTYEEPGGYRIMPNKQDNIDGPDDQAFVWRREKLRRMVIRDRSLPSMVIYNLKNEAAKPPDEDDISNMRMVHELDPGRIITYNSDRNRDIPYNERIEPDPYKLHLRPFDDTLYDVGWWDQHHWFGYSGYVDDNYENPRYYLRGVVDAPTVPVRADSLNRLRKDEIIFWGEEGSFGTMVRLQKIKEELEVTGATGFREMEHLDWFDTYDRFLDDSGFRKAYPAVDDLTMSLGRNMHYFHGRTIENIRMSNIADAVNVNGWAAAQTRTDIVDMYRNVTADPSILRHYTQPLYVAVKIRDKVLPLGDIPIADFWLINEENLNGRQTLEVTMKNPDSAVVFAKSFMVDLLGGEEFGQLLVEEVSLPRVEQAGYYLVEARITDGGMVKATGFDDVYAVDYSGGTKPALRCAVIETEDVVRDFLKKARGITAASYDSGMGAADVIIVGTHDFGAGEEDIYRDVFRRVSEGTSLIVLEHADRWAEQLNSFSRSLPPIYSGGGLIRRGGNGRLFVGVSPFLRGLPEAQGMSWEYQCFYKTDAERRSGRVEGISLHNWGTELIVALGAQDSKEILSALSRVRFGTGDVFLSTLFMVPNLASNEPQSAVAKKLLLNMLDVSAE